MANLESILQFLETAFETRAFPDYPQALNGLQVDGSADVRRIGAAVDASEQVILEGNRRDVDLLLVHHGLFWDGLGPVTGPRYRKLAALIRGRTALYSLHLPLDAHPEVGNCAILTRRIGLEPANRFGSVQGAKIGWWARAELDRSTLLERLRRAVSGEVLLVPGGSERLERVGIVTGSGASALAEAVTLGLDGLITGEAPHHAFHEAMEWGVNLFLCGHYATETFGVQALAGWVAREFSVDWEFLDFPTGL